MDAASASMQNMPPSPFFAEIPECCYVYGVKTHAFVVGFIECCFVVYPLCAEFAVIAFAAEKTAQSTAACRGYFFTVISRWPDVDAATVSICHPLAHRKIYWLTGLYRSWLDGVKRSH